MATGAPPHDDPLLGRTLAGTYRIDARLGAGAMGVVYRARHALLESDFAVKVLAPGVAADADARRRFLVEARSLAAFTHRNAVQVRHCGEDGGLLFLAMDLVRGETLAERLAREGPLEPPRAVAIVVDVLAALAEAHEHGIVHRDLKPGNVMVESTRGPSGSGVERVRVLDFGLARMVDADRAAVPSAFASLGGAVVGTVAYMAPEQLRAEDDVDGRADVFAAGILLYELLTGTLPFPGASTMSIALRIVEGTIEPWSPAALARVPPALRAVVERALAHERDDRFPSAAAMAEALVRAQREGVAPAAPPPASRPPPPSAAPSTPGLASPPPTAATTRRRRVGLAAVALVAVAVAAAFALRGRGDDATTVAAAAARARLAVEQGDWLEAVDAATAVLEARPGNAEMRLVRGEARTALLDRGAGEDLDAVARGRRDDPAVLVALARWHRRVLRDPASAERSLRAALTVDAAYVPARVERAEALLEAGDFDRAEVDVLAVETDAPVDPQGPWLRARLALARAAEGQPLAPAERDAGLAAAAAAAERATAMDPTWAGGPRTLSQARYRQAYEARAAGRYEEATRHWDAALAASSEAIARIERHPAVRRQGADRAVAHHERAHVRFARLEYAEAAEDLEAALRLSPREPKWLSDLAYARQQAGEHEKAIAAFERLYSITADKDPLFSQAFSWQRVGDERADRGDVPGAQEAYEKALDVYGRGIRRFPDAWDLVAYRGETHLRRAQLVRGDDRARELARARADFDGALAILPRNAEVLLRRAEAALVDERPHDALEDLDAAIGTRQDHTPRYYARRAAARLAVAATAGDDAAQDAKRRAWATGALADAQRAVDLLPAHARGVRPLLASARVALARLSPDEAERQALCTAALGDLELLVAEGPNDASDLARARATAAHGRAEVLLVQGDARGAVAAAEEAVALRDAEHAAGRWSLDARFLERLAEAREAAGDAAGARTARARAATLPR